MVHRVEESVGAVLDGDVVVPLDEDPASGRALTPALAIARRWGRRLRLVRVVDDYDELVGSVAELDGLVRDQSVEVETTAIMRDSVVEGICAELGDGDLLCMASHGAPSPRRGGDSVAEDIIATGRPALLVGPAFDPERTGGRIMVPIDETRPSMFALPPAAWLARVDRTPISVVTAVDFDPSAASATKARMDQLVERLRSLGLDANRRVLDGRSPALFAEATRSGAGLVVMATRSRRGVGRIVLGSTTRALVGTAPCPVLVMHPPD